MFNSIISTQNLTVSSELICLLASMGYGLLIALLYMFKSHYTKSYVVSIVILPALVQVVMMLVNGNLGLSVAILGAFSLIRYRSAPGTAKEITTVFFAMTIGLATGMGYVYFAGAIVVIVGVVFFVLNLSGFGERSQKYKDLKVLIPESLDYNDIFDDIFNKYTEKAELVKVRTTDLGTLFELSYQIILKDASKEKEFLDALRTKNGNLTIVLSRPREHAAEEL